MNPLPNFNIHRPRTIGEALMLLSELEDARPIAGGTDIIPLLRDRVLHAKNLVDLSLIGDLRGIREESSMIHVGPTTTMSQITSSELIKRRAPALVEAARSVGSPQTRNLGTIGGNLCNASPAADSAPALLVLDAEVDLASSEGSRHIMVQEVFAGPKICSLKPEEILTDISFPIPPETSTTSFQKLGRRRGYTLSQVNAASYLEFDGPVCCDARLALGAVASKPLRVREAEEILWNRRLSEKLVEEASSLCSGLVHPIDDIRASANYRRAMSCILVRRALNRAWEMGRRFT